MKARYYQERSAPQTSPKKERNDTSSHKLSNFVTPRTAKETNDLVEIILRCLPAIILALAVLVTAILAPGSIVAGMSAIGAAIKAFWR